MQQVAPSDKRDKVDGEPLIQREPTRPQSLPEMNDEHGSTTGIMPIFRDPADSSAQRDDNLPED